MRYSVASPEAYKLMHEGQIALAQVERNGARIDVDYLTQTIAKNKVLIQQKEQEIKDLPEFKAWEYKFGEKANIQSRSQLAWVLYDHLGVTCTALTKGGRRQVDDAVLQSINLPITKAFREVEKLKKSTNTFLSGIQKEVEGEFLHVFYNLNIARTFRSSSDKVNFQNIPIRDPSIGKMIRDCFIPREGNRLVEIDFSGIEVIIAACYHKDPRMLEYIKDKSKDMHRDMAAQCFILDPGQITKYIRYVGKNGFVFPEFYGDYYANCATSMWEMAGSKEGRLKDGTPLRDHLHSVGITSLGACSRDRDHRPVKGTFEYHMKEVEQDFWQRRFKKYAEWKVQWYEDYQATGGFETLTGFAVNGCLKKNDAINYPIQGSAFHCLLWCLIELQKELRRRKMKALVVGQIHDSILGDVPDNEIEEYVAICYDIMTKKLLQKWPWIIVPLEVEVEVSPLNGTWFQKKAWQI